MPSQVEHFYNSLAGAYHLLFEDWDRAIVRQAPVLDSVIQRTLGRPCQALHDCACGIGTQALGLAALGYVVSGSDLSQAATDRATAEAHMRNLSIPFRVADMTDLAIYPSASFDVLLACDNALPHLSAAQLLAAAAAFRRVLRPGGIVLASIRDYDAVLLTRPSFQGPSFFGSNETRRIVHQLWEWTGADAYELHQYISLQDGDHWQDLHFTSPYRCLLRAELTEALRGASFDQVEWLMPSTTGFYQPIVVARAV